MFCAAFSSRSSTSPNAPDLRQAELAPIQHTTSILSLQHKEASGNEFLRNVERNNSQRRSVFRDVGRCEKECRCGTTSICDAQIAQSSQPGLRAFANKDIQARQLIEHSRSGT